MKTFNRDAFRADLLALLLRHGVECLEAPQLYEGDAVPATIELSRRDGTGDPGFENWEVLDSFSFICDGEIHG